MSQAQNKEVLINIRLRHETREEFRVAAELRGATMSGLLHQFIVRTIREEKERAPDTFAKLQNTNLSEVEHSSEQPFDLEQSPMQHALYEKFLNDQKSKLSKTVNNLNKSDKDVRKK